MEVGLLGPLTFDLGTRPLVLTAPRERAVLAALALRPGQVVSTDRLISVLWGGDPPMSAAKTLQTYVAHLRRSMRPAASGTELLVTLAPGYLLDVEPGSVDVVRFEGLLRSARAIASNEPLGAVELFDQAFALWRGPPFADLEFSGELQAERRVLEERRVAGLEDRMSAAIAGGIHRQAIPELHRLVHEYPLRERLWASLIRALAADGQQGDALAAYQRCRRLLVEELGVEPGAELRHLEQQVLMQDPGLVASAPSTSPTRSGLASVLQARTATKTVGRDEALDAFVTRWRRREPGMMLVSGEPGIGKTQFAAAAAALAHGEATVLYGRCDEDACLPLQPFVEALDPLVARAVAEQDADADAASRVLAGVMPSVPLSTGPSPGDRRILVFDAITRLLARAAPMLLVLDDLHWADPATVQLLRQLGRVTGNEQILVLGTFRDGDVAGTPFAAALSGLLREPGTATIALGPLEPEQATIIVDQHLPTAPPTLRSSIVASSGGNPFFLHELARFHATSPYEQADAGRSDILREFVRSRIAGLPVSARDVLEAGAVLGEAFSLEVATSMLHDTPAESHAKDMDAVDAAARAGLVRSLDGRPGWWTFSHAITRDLVQAITGIRRRQVLHGRAGQLLARGADAQAAEAARHLDLASDPSSRQLRFELWCRASRSALHAAGQEAAVRYAREAVRLADGGPEDAEARTVLAEALWRAGSFGEARREAVAAASVAGFLGDVDLFARATLLALGDFPGFDFGTGHPDAQAFLRSAATTMFPAHSALGAKVLAGWAWAASSVGEHRLPIEERRELSRRAVDLARQSGDEAATPWVLLASRLAGATLNNADERLVQSAEAAAIAERTRDLRLATQANLWCFGDLLELGRVDEAFQRLRRLRELAGDLDEPYLRWVLVETAAMLALLDGRLGEAERAATEAAALGNEAENSNAAQAFAVQLFLIRWAADDLISVAPLADVVAGHPVASLFGWRAALAMLRLSAGAQDDARNEYGVLLDALATPDVEDLTVTIGAVVLSEIAISLGDREGAANIGAFLGPFATSWPTFGGALTLGSVDRSLGRLALLVGDVASAQRHLLRASRAHAAFPLLRALTHVALAEARIRADADFADAERLLASAEADAHTFGARRVLHDAGAVRARYLR